MKRKEKTGGGMEEVVSAADACSGSEGTFVIDTSSPELLERSFNAWLLVSFIFFLIGFSLSFSVFLT